MGNTVMYDINGILDVASLIEKGNREFEDEYQNVLNQTVDGNVFVKKLNFSQKINRFNFRKQNIGCDML